jgi:2-polyprenyl-3-methyl-5-hydroxy-6-metoxy-1,4-benzoquinol methylase
MIPSKGFGFAIISARDRPAQTPAMKTHRYANSLEEMSASASKQRLACALCGSTNAEQVLEKRIDGPGAALTFRLWRCTACGLVRTEPQLTPQELVPHYAEEYWGGIEAADANWIRRDQRFRTGFLRRFRSEGSVLDVGCGLGFFLRALDPQRWERNGIEPMPVPYREAARSLGSDRIFNTELIAARLPSGKFDVITFWDSLEHLPNPRAILQEAGRLLRPGGIILIGLPNFGGYQARHFAEDWFGLSLPHHLCHYTRDTLARLLEQCGFRVRAMEDRSGPENYHALKHSLLNRLTRLHGPRGGRALYYAVKPFLHPWEWISTRWGGGSSLQVCADRVSPEAAGFSS